MSAPSSSSATGTAETFSIQAEGGSKREEYDVEKTRQLLKPLLEKTIETDKIVKIVLGGKSYGSDSAPLFALALQSTPNLGHADFSDIIAGRHTDDALNTLQILADGVQAAKLKLHTLDLSDNAVGVRGIPRIANAIRSQPDLHHLFLNNAGLEVNAVKQLTELILESQGGLDADSKLRTLEIGDNCMEDAGFRALIPLIEKSPHLERLSIATTRVRSQNKEGLEMATCLLKLKNLTSLGLNDNNLGSEAAAVISKVIDNNKDHLRSLNLGDIGVEDEIGQILDAITRVKPNTLEMLDLSASELGPSKVFIKPLVKIIKNQAGSLVHLKLEDNELKARGVGRLLKELSKCKKLTYLNFSNTAIGPKVVAQLLEFLSNNPQLEEVHLNSNRFPAEQLQQIKDTMSAKKEALGTMSENDEDEEEEDDDASSEEEEEEEANHNDKDVDALASNLAGAAISN